MTIREQPVFVKRGMAAVAAIGNFLAAIFLGGNYRFRETESTDR